MIPLGSNTLGTLGLWIDATSFVATALNIATASS